ncbi:putative glutathione S-transferase [Peziza echinospora]|nr:putative glutathione S-transferase [Peziza echinospora]
MAGPKITLYTNHLCPYAHRAHVALEELGLEFEEVHIPLDRPRDQWYLDINPRGLVPSLKYGDHIITESLIVTEFLADLAPSHLIPQPNTVEGAVARARQRFFIDTFSTKILSFWMKAFQLGALPGTEAHTNFGNEFVAAIEKELEPLLHDAAPFFGGSDKPTLAEVNTGSFLLRLWALSTTKSGEYIPAAAVRKLEALPNFGKWAKATLAHPSVLSIWDEDAVVTTTVKKYGRKTEA